MAEQPDRARVVIIGGGVSGCSVAYHLAKLGWDDVVLLERDKLTSGTTWHAAGLVVSGGMTTETLAWMTKYSRDLYEVLEAETGLSTGFRAVGYLQTSSSDERTHKLRREADFLRLMGIEREEISPAEVADLWPQIDTGFVTAGFYTANEGRADPANVAMSLAKGARMGGVRVIEDTPVTGITHEDGRVTGVVTAQGTVEAEFVVNCGGMWAKQIGAMAGVAVPLQAIEHAYLITEPFEGVSPDLPIFEDPDRYAYYREETGGVMVGLFEPVSAPWSLDRVPDDFSFGEIPSNWERLAPFLELAMETLPALEHVGVRKLFTGPESFTPDNGFLVGESPELVNFFIAAGFNSLGILTGGGAGSVIAHWIVDGLPPIDVTDMDPARLLPWQTNRSYLAERSTELLGRLHSTGSWPHSHPKTARNVRRSPIHERLEAAGAHFSEAAGWELTAWFAPAGAAIEPRLSYRRQDWFDHHAAEHRAVRNGVALFDMSAMSKFLVQGPGAERMLNWISGNNVAVSVGQSVYTQWMNENGGVEADLTVTRIGQDRFMVVVAESFHRRTESMMRRAIGADTDVAVTDVTSAYALLSVQGPESRSLLTEITTADLSNEAFPYFTAQTIDLHYGPALAFRLSFVGELGWEVYIPTEFALGVYDRLVEAGAGFGLTHAGMETLESTRTEAGRKDYGLDMENSDSALEAGFRFALDFDKPGGFVGRDALLRQWENRPLTSRLVLFLLEDPEPLLYGEEPILLDGEPVGYLRSGAYGHTLGGAMGFGYVEHADGVTLDLVRTGSFEIVVASERYPAQASLRAMYDPQNERVHM
jgi:glycine cleavage system aminomethyltransferase T/glycine/D-amino acid oxidase-like deaminating enzyme